MINISNVMMEHFVLDEMAIGAVVMTMGDGQNVHQMRLLCVPTKHVTGKTTAVLSALKYATSISLVHDIVQNLERNVITAGVARLIVVS